MARFFGDGFARTAAAAQLVVFTALARGGAELHGAEGVFPSAAWLVLASDLLAWNPSTGWGGLIVAVTWPWAFLAGIVGCVAFLLSTFRAPRLAGPRAWRALGIAGAALALLASSAIHARNPLLSNSSDVLAGQLLLLAALVTSRTHGARTGGDESGLAPDPDSARHDGAALVVACYGLVVYAGSVVFKARSAHWWPELSALGRALRTEDLATPLGLFLAREMPEPLVRAACAGALVVEAVSPVALVVTCAHAWARAGRSPRADTWMRWCGIAAAGSLVALHVGILVTLSIGPFPWVCLALWVPFLFDSRPGRLVGGGGIPETPDAPVRHRHAPLPRAAVAFVSACACVLGLTLAFPRIALEGRAHVALYLLHLKQHWSMFSPSPTHSTRYEIEGLDTAGNRLPVGPAPFPGDYAWKVYSDVFWSDAWNPDLRVALGVRVAEWACDALMVRGTPALSVEIHAVRDAHSGDDDERLRIARAGCRQSE